MHSLCCAFVTKVVHPFASSEVRQASKNYNAAKKILAIVPGFVIFVNIFFSVHTNIPGFEHPQYSCLLIFNDLN